MQHARVRIDKQYPTLPIAYRVEPFCFSRFQRLRSRLHPETKAKANQSRFVTGVIGSTLVSASATICVSSCFIGSRVFSKKLADASRLKSVKFQNSNRVVSKPQKVNCQSPKTITYAQHVASLLDVLIVVCSIRLTSFKKSVYIVSFQRLRLMATRQTSRNQPMLFFDESDLY